MIIMNTIIFTLHPLPTPHKVVVVVVVDMIIMNTIIFIS